MNFTIFRQVLCHIYYNFSVKREWRIRFQPEVVSAKKQLTFFAGEARILLEKVVDYLVLILVQLWFDDQLGFSHPG